MSLRLTTSVMCLSGLLGCTATGDGAASSGASLRPRGDADGDGYLNGRDCAPLDDAIHPGAPEVCNRVDDNCDGNVDEPMGSTYCIRVDEPRPTSALCDGRRRVGVLAAGTSCPSASPAWASVELLQHATSASGTGFCAYEYTGPGNPPGTLGLPSDAGRPPAAWLDPDCEAVAPMTPTPAVQALQLVFPAFEAGYRAQLESPAALPVISAGAAMYPQPVEIAIVDASPAPPGPPRYDVAPASPRSNHARLMGRAIEEVACPARVASGGPCAVEFAHHLALDRVAPDGHIDPRGGHYGFIGTLATEIESAVLDWQARGRTNRIIINLSLGFDDRFTEIGGHTRAAVLAVRSALDFATCQGALVFAASGNRVAGPDSLDQSGPLLPAAFADVPSSCGLGPVVYPVGAVDETDRPLHMTREGGLPELVAPARFAALDLAAHGAAPRPSTLLTGTSLGSAAASGMAALVWAYLPSFSADQVMALLRDEGSVPLSLPQADVCAHPPCDPPRRLSACATLQAAINLRCASTPHAAGCAPVPALPCQAHRIAAHGGAAVVVPPNSFHLAAGPSASGLTDLVDSPDCPFPVRADATHLSAHPDLCPGSQYFAAEADPGRVVPQPPGSPCSVCVVDLVYDGAYLAIDPQFATPITSVSLIIDEGDMVFDLTSAFASGTTFVSPGAEAYVSDLGLPAAINRAQLEFGLDDGNELASTRVDIPFQ
ncbi:MAG: S8 family serine peptidase [Myxococcota bacterium]